MQDKSLSQLLSRAAKLAQVAANEVWSDSCACLMVMEHDTYPSGPAVAITTPEAGHSMSS